jgi:hypothetical protein
VVYFDVSLVVVEGYQLYKCWYSFLFLFLFIFWRGR